MERSSPRGDDVPRFYFSFRSPYSWLAHCDLENQYRDVADRLRWLPFWEPDAWSARLLQEAGGAFSYAPMSRAKHLYILQDVRRLAAQRGMAVTWPVDRSPCWEVPHLAYVVAEQHGLGRQFVALVYRARWQENRNICDRSTMADVAECLGLDPEAVANAADDAGRRREGVEALLAVHRDGVFGVPFFVNRFDKYWGVDRLQAFVESLPGALRSSSESDRLGHPAIAVAASDEGTVLDHAGGCG